MKAAAFAEFGGPEVLTLTDLPDPAAGAGQVRVRVRAAGVQPYDTAVRSGWTPPGIDPAFPRIPGNEFAGVVDRVGDGVTGVAAGDEVLGFTQLGAYAELVVVGANQVAVKPAGMPWEVAGGFAAGTNTARLALDQLEVGKDDTLLVHAAAGSVGQAAVQLAARRGATVIGTASPANHDFVRSLGGIPVEYGDGLLERVRAVAPGGIDAVIDGAGGAAFDVSLDLVADRSKIVTLVDHDRAPGLGVQLVRPPAPEYRQALMAELAGQYADGELRLHVRAAYPLERAADAHRDSETGHGRGKIVITVG